LRWLGLVRGLLVVTEGRSDWVVRLVLGSGGWRGCHEWFGGAAVPVLVLVGARRKAGCGARQGQVRPNAGGYGGRAGHRPGK
jgi:hypothetical protein